MPEALCFDVYGTVCDVSSVRSTIRETLDVPAGVAGDVDAHWRRKQLEYAFQRAAMDDYASFFEVTGDALDYALDYHALDASAAERDTILGAYDQLEPYPDAVDALDALGETYEVVALSNGNPEMLARLVENAGLEECFADVLSADAAGTLKPAPGVYETAADALGYDVEECMLVSSNAWDVAGSSAAGMQAAWVNRGNDPAERVGGDADIEAASLAALAEAL
ncbi:haloacid dehalogenase type II [Halocalculus aciditolerans]|uniref:Haloacid dehalogenase n=1 Tax=Halocalculus aciditolerans TaxID=1383812 RepID=A0A830F426_9EURY|nr:haloacid dehalogenase type II [Halocalculus aciditolerans]GGL61412.1 haloacid dehalogenase [Halocalculus aciditolerans]